MSHGVDLQVFAVADDLSGAAETAMALRGTRSVVMLRPQTVPADVVVLDLDTRSVPPASAAQAVTSALAHAPPGHRVFKKIDSLLRGNVAEEIAALADAGYDVVLTPALPIADRVVREGVLHVAGQPLHESDAWRAEHATPPRSLAEALAPAEIRTVGLDVVRDPEALTEALRAGGIISCDAETDADLDAIAHAATQFPSGPASPGLGSDGLGLRPPITSLRQATDTSGPSNGIRPQVHPANPSESPTRAPRGTLTGVALAGSGGLAAALGRVRSGGTVPNAPFGTVNDAVGEFGRWPAAGGAPATATPSFRSHNWPTASVNAPNASFRASPAGRGGEGVAPRGPLVVVGTAASVAVAQVEQLRGVTVYSLDPGELVSGAVSLPPLSGPTVVRVDPGASVEPARARAVAAGLAATVAAVVREPVDLVLIGGETGRRVLDALGVDMLEPVEAVHHGAVLSRVPGGGLVVTRPGSFGGPDSLVRIVRHLEQKGVPVTSTENLPIVAVTMGDGAGIGPEVIVPAVLHPDTLAVCRPVVVGDAERLRQAAGLVGVSANIVAIAGPEEAVFGDGRVNVIDLGLLPADLAWGELSAAAGEAAFQYIRVAAELALATKVHGICTAPLNKEALHAAGHLFPGHTELLAHLTGVDEVSMMLSTPKVKVIHVTTHIGLIDAIARIEPGLVERTVRRGHEALVRAGNPRPVIGVCGINPHAGENGLFGYGEEEEKIVPALESLRAQGIDACGPLPADTAFFLAGRGDYDLIVAMYHDQGHGPVKVLGIEAGVNLTVGLPVIRTSVDHGTAFDIAGTGKADPRSMVEALRQAAELATMR